MPERPDFCERPELVERFAERDPDERLRDLAGEYTHPPDVRILDAGCAGGRNTVLLARKGFDVYAMDASAAMVAETRRRLGEVIGPRKARRRVRIERMDDLSCYGDDAFDLVVSLGLFHNAATWAEWSRAVAETARVLVRGGRLLVSQFTPRTDLTGRGSHPVQGEPHLFEDALPGRRSILLGPSELDAEMAREGLVPETPTTTAETVAEKGRRVSVKGLYLKG